MSRSVGPVRYAHWIGGAEVQPAAGRFLPSHSPTTGEVVCEVADGTARDVDTAVAAAAAAFRGWSRRRPIERGRLLIALAASLTEQADRLARLESDENGMPLPVARSLILACVLDSSRRASLPCCYAIRWTGTR